MILIVIDSLERYYFATRLVNAVRHEYEFAFLTSEPVAHLGLLLGGFRSVYLNRLMPIDVPDGQPADRTPYQLSIEVMNGQMTEARAKRESAAIFHIALEVLRGLRIEQCVMWNGQQLVCRAVRQACTVQGVATRFIEIFSGKSKMMPGESFAMEFTPGRGTQFFITGQPQGEPVGDDEFFGMVLKIWVGASPADYGLKDALLGHDKGGQ